MSTPALTRPTPQLHAWTCCRPRTRCEAPSRGLRLKTAHVRAMGSPWAGAAQGRPRAPVKSIVVMNASTRRGIATYGLESLESAAAATPSRNSANTCRVTTVLKGYSLGTHWVLTSAQRVLTGYSPGTPPALTSTHRVLTGCSNGYPPGAHGYSPGTLRVLTGAQRVLTGCSRVPCRLGSPACNALRAVPRDRAHGRVGRRVCCARRAVRAGPTRDNAQQTNRTFAQRRTA
jgi:hypothetical protein